MGVFLSISTQECVIDTRHTSPTQLIECLLFDIHQRLQFAFKLQLLWINLLTLAAGTSAMKSRSFSAVFAFTKRQVVDGQTGFSATACSGHLCSQTQHLACLRLRLHSPNTGLSMIYIKPKSLLQSADGSFRFSYFTFGGYWV